MAKKNRNEYMRTYMLERYRTRRADAIKYLGGKCFVCGVENSISKLDFDHIDRKTKGFTIARLWSVNKKRFWEEVEKCQLLCKTCHIEKTAAEVLPPHGSISRYIHRKKPCKCELCKGSRAKWDREYRKRKKRITINGKRITVDK